MYIYIYVHTHAYIYVCTYKYTHMYICMCTNIHIKIPAMPAVNPRYHDSASCANPTRAPVAVYCRVLQCVAVCCSQVTHMPVLPVHLLQRVAVCCSVLQSSHTHASAGTSSACYSSARYGSACYMPYSFRA